MMREREDAPAHAAIVDGALLGLGVHDAMLWSMVRPLAGEGADGLARAAVRDHLLPVVIRRQTLADALGRYDVAVPPAPWREPAWPDFARF